jgi:hypothetical protein
VLSYHRVPSNYPFPPAHVGNTKLVPKRNQFQTHFPPRTWVTLPFVTLRSGMDHFPPRTWVTQVKANLPEPNFQISRRRENLSFSHHMEVCSIDDPAMQDKLLDWCLSDTKRKTRHTFVCPRLRSSNHEALRRSIFAASGLYPLQSVFLPVFGPQCL